jgi:tight adherence protein B
MKKFVNSKNGIKKRHFLFSIVIALAASQLLIGSALLTLPFFAFGALAPVLIHKRKVEKRRAQLAVLWPELLDHMISGLRSGLSIAETLIGLAIRGPEVSRPIFMRCQILLSQGADMPQIFNLIKGEFNDPVADQVCEVLDFARGTGSRDTAITLRTLGDFIRSDIAVRGEIGAKLGWIKNSAIVAALAPWILLLILSSQPSTLKAFSTGTGFLIIITGIGMSLLAYFWMSRVGRIRTLPRIFLGEIR